MNCEHILHDGDCAMKILIFLIGLSLFSSSSATAAQTTIIETEGTACMGENMSRKQTQQAAITEAKRKAVEHLSTHITSETQVFNSELKNDQIFANANAEVSVIAELEKDWYKDPTYGECYRVKIKAKVDPNAKQIEKPVSHAQSSLDLQAKCAEAAEDFVGRLNDPASYFPHYSKKLDGCYMRVGFYLGQTNEKVKLKNGKEMNIKHSNFMVTLYNVFEGKMMGTVAHEEGKEQECWVGNTKCTTVDEFENLIRPYTEE